MSVFVWFETKDGKVAVPYKVTSHPIKGVSDTRVNGEPAFITKLQVIPRPRRWRRALAAAGLFAVVAVLFSALLLLGCGAPAARPDSEIDLKRLEYLDAAAELDRARGNIEGAWEKCVGACRAMGFEGLTCRILLCPRTGR